MDDLPQGFDDHRHRAVPARLLSEMARGVYRARNRLVERHRYFVVCSVRNFTIRLNSRNVHVWIMD
jgi:hypothetical protein